MISKEEATRLVEDNINIVYSIIHKYHLSNEAEAESIAMEALYKATLTYDTENITGAKFSSYAYVCVSNRLGDLIRKMKNKTSSMILLMSDITAGVDEEAGKSFAEAAIYASSEDIQSNYEAKAECTVVVMYLKEIISITKPGIRKEILETWFYKHSCQCKVVDLANECGCGPSYVRKVLLETRSRLTNKAADWRR